MDTFAKCGDGSHGLFFETKILFEHNSGQDTEISGVDIVSDAEDFNYTGTNVRKDIGLPCLSELEVVRHYSRLSRKNFSIDTNFYPLGSCTMKYNPRINEKIARLSGFASLHPLQHESTIQGALELMWELQYWLKELSGFSHISLNPAAGAHGELTGVMVIKKAHESQGNQKEYMIIPDSAHGTNPATSVMCGYKTITVNTGSDGLCSVNDIKSIIEKHEGKIAGIMLTNPNTCGKFESNITEICDLIHEAGGYVYCDGANFNAILCKARPGDFGADVMHFNLHKTFSTPHGGGGPGSGPIGVVEELGKFLPVPFVIKKEDGSYGLQQKTDDSIGVVKSFYGQFGMFVRALAYMVTYGKDGLKQVSEDAVLSANYILSHLRSDYDVAYEGYCMHECLLTDKIQRKEAGVTTNDIAKLLLQCGIHPMTVYFPLVVKGAMLIEPTETEGKEEMDHFIAVMKVISNTVSGENGERLHGYHPESLEIVGVDEKEAALKPLLSWKDIMPQ